MCHIESFDSIINALFFLFWFECRITLGEHYDWCNGTGTFNHLVLKQTSNHVAKLALAVVGSSPGKIT